MRILFEYSGFLIAGTVIALVWANVAADRKVKKDTALTVTAGTDHYDLEFRLKEAAKITIAIRDSKGKQVRELVHYDEREAGVHHETWDRKDEDGNVVADGEYTWYVKAHGSYNRFVHLRLFGGDHEEHEDEENGDDGTAHASEHDEGDGDGHAVSTPKMGILATVFDRVINRPDEHGHRHGINVHFLINDIFMALFFAIAGKEVWESMLPGGALSNPRKAATPLMATLGGIVGPAGIYVAGVFLFTAANAEGNRPLMPGWAIPCATDIAFSYLVARVLFGSGHPAIAFLLLLAIADDAAGLVILAVAYPSKELELVWLLLAAAAIGIGFLFRKFRFQNFWWYLLIPGVMSWISFDLAGIHPALGLVPIIPCMPHAHTDLGVFAREELNRDDTLNAFEHWWKNPVEIILGLFGLANAGVVLSSAGTGTWLVLAGLLLGKPLGIALFTLLAEKVFRLEIPQGMSYRHIVTLGMIASIGFTVALFVSTAAFKTPGPIQDSVKMGALLSFLGAVVAIIGAKVMGVRPTNSEAA